MSESVSRVVPDTNLEKLGLRIPIVELDLGKGVMRGLVGSQGLAYLVDDWLHFE